ncbi:MAG TPA: MBL fold metallo-hydrolase [Candidatus Limnocylindria bacterium]|jgi:N-acyl homoserine lactone hydrolase|nr:MBL fold metallo-hydrolase [Candidatus Limnocylindria bacterium]
MTQTAAETLRTVDYRLDVLITGYPGRTTHHGGLGWSTVALLSNADRRILIDVSSFGARPRLMEQLRATKFTPDDITDILLTHSHWDHSINYTLFPNANIVISEKELAWAAAQAPGQGNVPELYIRDLVASPRVRRVNDGDEVAPGVVAHAVTGHTPGHMVYVATMNEYDIIFTGDSAKNRAELLSRTVDMTVDPASSVRSLEKIWGLWKKRPESIIVPGHDVMMRLRDGEPYYLAKREAAIKSWLGTDLIDRKEYDLA